MLKRFGNRIGAALVEYVILIAAVVGIAAAVTVVTDAIDSKYDDVADQVGSL